MRRRYTDKQILLARERRKRYERKNPEKVKSSKAKYVEKNRDKINLKNNQRAKKKWWTNPEKYRKQQREKYHANLEENREKQRKYYRDNIEKQRQWAKKYTLELRKRVIIGYGGRCSCCYEERYEFLALDHVKGGGNKERKSGKHTYSIYRDAEKKDFPNIYRILCHNCNNALGFYGYCPHNLAKNE